MNSRADIITIYYYFTIIIFFLMKNKQFYFIRRPFVDKTSTYNNTKNLKKTKLRYTNPVPLVTHKVLHDGP